MLKIKSLIGNVFMAVMIGLLVGIVSIFFNMAIDSGVELTRNLLHVNTVYYLFLPIIGGIIMYLIHMIYLKEDHSGVGIVQVLVELSIIKTHLMKPFRVLIRVIAATSTLIFGFSVGRFGPIVHLGASIGSNIAYHFKLSPEYIRLMIGCGAAAAISAVFRMPLFAAIFVLEVLYRRQYSKYFAPVVISAIIANQLGVMVQGPAVHWTIEAFQMRDAWRMVLLGISMGIVGILYISILNKTTLWFSNHIKAGYQYLGVAIIIGCIGYFFPLNFEIHEQTTIRILMGEFGAGLLIMIGFVKMLTTGLVLGSGYIGGNFYPVVTMGAAFGGLFGSNAAYPVLGMGGLISSYLNAPIAGIVWVLEFSGQFDLLVPALIVSSLAVSTTYHLLDQDVFTVPYKKLMAGSE